MSYKIDSYSLKEYVTRKWIKIPRFQRAKTWNEKQKFELVLSVFKKYPLGCVILCKEKGQDSEYLIDGRQRYSALQEMLTSPDIVYGWAQKYLSLKKGDIANVIADKFWEKVRDFTDYSPNDELESSEDEQNDDSIENAEDENEDNSSSPLDEGTNTDNISNDDLLGKLLALIQFCSSYKNQNNIGPLYAFDFKKYIANTDKFERKFERCGKKGKISSSALLEFINSFRSSYSDQNGNQQLTKENFIQFVEDEFGFKTPEDKNKYIRQQLNDWEGVQLKAIEFYDLFDNILSSNVIAVVSVENVGTTDEEKIFNLINSNGTPLTAAEILSSKPDWNKPISVSDEDRKALISSIYTRILKASTPKGFVKWDLPASLPFALKKNQNFDFLFPISSIKDDSASKLITLGFKISSGIILGAIKKEDLDKLGKSTEINEDTFVTIESDIKRMLVSMLSIPYFEVYKSWSLSLSRLIGDAPTLCFLFMTYYMFKIELKPEPSDNNFHLFKRNCIAIIDRLIFEYVRSQWKGSSDSLLAKELANFIKNYTKGTQIEAISEQSWKELVDDICNNGEVNHKPISFGLVKPLIAHYNAIKQLKCEISYDFKPEFDHIIPQTAFGDKKDKTQSKLRDNLFNLALLPKVSNASKNDRPLQATLSNESLVSNIEKYEEIKKEDFAKFNKKENIDALKEYRRNNFYKAFGEFRNNILK